jgi:L-fucose mutarotase
VLKGIDPVLSPALLAALARMGHGDVVGIVDRNYPAYAAGVEVVELAVDVPTAVRAIVSLMPVDGFDGTPVRHMLTDDGEEGPVADEVRASVNQAESREVASLGVPRLEFYPAARECSVMVRTIEDRPYACFMLAKGVL